MWYNVMWYDAHKLKDEWNKIISKRTREGTERNENFKLSRYKVSYTRDNIDCYAYRNQVSARKLISEHGKNHMITSIIDTSTGKKYGTNKHILDKHYQVMI